MFKLKPSQCINLSAFSVGPWRAKGPKMQAVGCAEKPHDPTISLMASAASGNAAGVRAALAEGASLDALSPEGEPPLHLAVLASSLECVKVLLDKGAEVDQEDRSGRTALVLAVTKSGSVEVAQALLDGGAELDRETGYPGGTRTALHLACESVEDVALLLLTRGANTHKPVRDWFDHGWLPLHKAAARGFLKAVRAIVAKGGHGADLNALCVVDYQCGPNKTPLDLAEGNVEMVALLESLAKQPR